MQSPSNTAPALLPRHLPDQQRVHATICCWVVLQASARCGSHDPRGEEGHDPLVTGPQNASNNTPILHMPILIHTHCGRVQDDGYLIHQPHTSSTPWSVGGWLLLGWVPSLQKVNACGHAIVYFVVGTVAIDLNVFSEVGFSSLM